MRKAGTLPPPWHVWNPASPGPGTLSPRGVNCHSPGPGPCTLPGLPPHLGEALDTDIMGVEVD